MSVIEGSESSDLVILLVDKGYMGRVEGFVENSRPDVNELLAALNAHADALKAVRRQAKTSEQKKLIGERIADVNYRITMVHNAAKAIEATCDPPPRS